MRFFEQAHFKQSKVKTKLTHEEIVCQISVHGIQLWTSSRGLVLSRLGCCTCGRYLLFCHWCFLPCFFVL